MLGEQWYLIKVDRDNRFSLCANPTVRYDTRCCSVYGGGKPYQNIDEGNCILFLEIVVVVLTQYGVGFLVRALCYLQLRPSSYCGSPRKAATLQQQTGPPPVEANSRLTTSRRPSRRSKTRVSLPATQNRRGSQILAYLLVPRAPLAWTTERSTHYQR